MRSINGSARLRLYKRESANQIVGRIAQPGTSRWELEDVAAWRQRSERVSHNQTGYNRVVRIVGTHKSGVVIVSTTEDPEVEWQ